MTTVYKHDGKILMEDGKIAIDEACCCYNQISPSPSPNPSESPSPSPPAECVCPDGCVEGLSISLGGNPSCGGGSYSDSIGCNGGTIDASMTCVGGVWKVAVQLFCITPEEDGFCFAQYGADLPCENDNLPPAGNVNLTLILSNIPNCYPPPNTIIIKP